MRRILVFLRNVLGGQRSCDLFRLGPGFVQVDRATLEYFERGLDSEC